MAGEANTGKKPTAEVGKNCVHFEHKFCGSFEDLYFRLTDQTADGQVLSKVAEGLQFVRGLRVGDPLPKEILTREASWEPSERHLRIARQRLTMQLVTWLAGNEHIFTSSEKLGADRRGPAGQKGRGTRPPRGDRALGSGTRVRCLGWSR